MNTTPVPSANVVGFFDVRSVNVVSRILQCQCKMYYIQPNNLKHTAFSAVVWFIIIHIMQVLAESTAQLSSRKHDLGLRPAEMVRF